MSSTCPKPDGEIVLSLQGISRQSGVVQALQANILECLAGEACVVVGENGSGTSTRFGVASGFVMNCVQDS
ncbi:MAG TPA: hypothetical protein VJZ27_05925 [Aggregatilineales bacterium]|nr:hypothetical protein [Aggregatilineales bacterium]